MNFPVLTLIKVLSSNLWLRQNPFKRHWSNERFLERLVMSVEKMFLKWVCEESFGQLKKQGDLREEGLLFVT